jgi:hypothetical protein
MVKNARFFGKKPKKHFYFVFSKDAAYVSSQTEW